MHAGRQQWSRHCLLHGHGWADHVHQLLSCISTLGQGSCGNTVTMSPVSWTNHIEKEKEPTPWFILWSVEMKEMYKRERAKHYLHQQLDMDSFVTNTWSLISKKNRKLSIHYSASSECFHYTIEASPLYSLNNHPSSSTHSCNSKSHAKYGEETFQSKQAHRIVHWHFLPTNGIPHLLFIWTVSIFIVCKMFGFWNSNPVLILLWEASLLWT